MRERTENETRSELITLTRLGGPMEAGRNGSQILTTVIEVKRPNRNCSRFVKRFALATTIFATGFGKVILPNALAREYPNADVEWAWQWAFPAPTRYYDEEAKIERSHHLHETAY